MPIIILSARGQKTDKLKGLKLGADDYITKPFDLQGFWPDQRRPAPLASGARTAACRQARHRLPIAARQLRPGAGASDTPQFELLRYLAERREKSCIGKSCCGRCGDTWTRTSPRSVTTRLFAFAEDRADPHHPEFIRTVHGDGACLMLRSRGS